MTGSARPLDCVSAMQRLWDYLDGELTPDRMEAVRRHIDECAACLPHADWARTFLAALAAARRSPNGAGEGTRERVLGALRRAGYSG